MRQQSRFFWLLSLLAFVVAYRTFLFLVFLPDRAEYAAKIGVSMWGSVDPYAEGKFDGLTIRVSAWYSLVLATFGWWLPQARIRAIVGTGALAALLSGTVARLIQIAGLHGSWRATLDIPTAAASAIVLSFVALRGRDMDSSGSPARAADER